ncbi:MAG: hypothetical protein JRE88_11315 [Deltaproteobacteria bacterium]|jgi:hypothetical protein|nr:hypothetical protein [Deltaproteobacteria bacterium]MBW2517364.1 hypothetical protein [Deltaproteobacteria bacterium]
MISNNCDFSHFVAAIKDKTYDDIIYLADQEATAAERIFFRNNSDNNERKKCGQKYAAILKKLIVYMRSNVRPQNSEDEYVELFAMILDSINSTEKILEA